MTPMTPSDTESSPDPLSDFEATASGERQLTANSFAYFVYPFQFDADKFDAYAIVIDNAAMLPANKADEGDRSQKIWSGDFRFSLSEVMPHVARYLEKDKDNPRHPATARIWKLSKPMEYPCGLCGTAEWTLHTGKKEIPFVLGEAGSKRFSVLLMLFSVGVGFLVLSARPRANSLDTWIDFLHGFRYASGDHNVTVTARRRTGKGQWASFTPQIGSSEQKEFLHIGDFAHALLSAGNQSSAGAQWWSDVFVPGRLIPFAGLSIQGGRPDEEMPLLLYRLRHFFSTAQPVCPSADDLSPGHPALMCYAERHWFVVTQEGTAFVSWNAPPHPFFHGTLQSHLRDEYFLPFLLAMHQRAALIRLSEEVARTWIPRIDDKNSSVLERQFDRIRSALLLFVARGYFMQVTQRENHHRYFGKCQEVFDIAPLYQEVRDEVGDLYAYHAARGSEELQRTERNLSHFIRSFGAAFPVVSLPLTLLSLNFFNFNHKHPKDAFYTALGSICLGAATGLAVYYRGKPRQDAADGAQSKTP